VKLRAIIFDVYKTLLHVGPPPSDRDARWEVLVDSALGSKPRLNLTAFQAECDWVIAREHTLARSVGIAFPEIFWPDVVLEVMPELRKLGVDARNDFLFRQQELFRTTRLMPGAATVIGALRERGLLLGVASNAQPYTWRELDEAMTAGGLEAGPFAPDVCFWSFAHGFSKPDPHVFRFLTARLNARGISPDETLMVGDRLDNDISPARAQGWRTWRLTSTPDFIGEGDWETLGNFLSRNHAVER
jgi:putative hydrolase of the HAD superfamily